MNTNLKLSPEVIEAIRDSQVKVGVVIPPVRQLSKKAYADYKKAMLSIEGEWQPTKGCFHFPFHVQLPKLMRQAVKTGEMPRRVQYYQEFFTPDILAEKMACLVNEAMYARATQPERVSVLEPSAGKGALVNAVLGFHAPWEWNVCACEIQSINADAIPRDHRVRVVEGDFLEQVSPVYAGSQNDGCAYDAVLMNPPFAGNAWLNHIEHAIKFMGPNSVLVAVVPCTATLPKLTFIKDKSNVHITPAPQFEFVGTGIKVSILTIGIHPKLIKKFFHHEEVIEPEVMDVGTPEQHIKAIRKELATMVRELDALERELRS